MDQAEFPKFFPYDKVRPTQDALIRDVAECIKSRTNMIVHAPTGIGKTVSVISPLLEHAEQNNKVIFFLTSRHTQHKIAIETLKEIKEKHSLKIPTTDIIAKKWICPVPGVLLLKPGEFLDYCKIQRGENKCEYYTNTRSSSKLTVRGKKAVEDLKNASPCHIEEATALCNKDGLCAYEVIAAAAASSRVIIADYNYIFHPHIRIQFLNKIGKTMEDCIIVIDEGHNVIERIRESFTLNLGSFVMDRAIKEATKNNLDECSMNLRIVRHALDRLSVKLEKSNELRNEALVSREEFISLIEEDISEHFPAKQGHPKKDYAILAAELEFASIQLTKEGKRSFIAMVAYFLAEWKEDNAAFVRIISTKEPKHDKADEYQKEKEAESKNQNAFNGFVSADSLIETKTSDKTGYSSYGMNHEKPKFNASRTLSLSRLCLDPSISTKEVIESSYCTLMMSGTLTPTSMYRDLLGFPKNTKELSYPDPFPKENRLNLIVPETTTKFSKRTKEQFDRIGAIAADITNIVPGNSIVFFPSYSIRDKAYDKFSLLSKKTCFVELPQMTKQEKADMFDRFKKYKEIGAVMLAVIGGSFSEGIDLPGDLLKAVVVVGVPLQQPDLETKKLIEYYDRKFSKGWDYGYLFPAMNKVMQAAGRCIRSETDKGVVVFLDERYADEHYRKCFSPEQKMIVTKLYASRISEFFAQKP